jgi:hypothetical protein
MNTTHYKKAPYTILTIMILLLCISSYCLWTISTETTKERTNYHDEIIFLQAGEQLAKASDYLTAEARAFSVTGDPRHLENYWHEVNTKKQRNLAIATLESLNSDNNLNNLLIQSKRNSDALIQTELQSMRAVLEAYKVPDDLMPPPIDQFSLPHNVEILDAQKKILSAQKILYDKQYYLDKQSIMAPIAAFNKLAFTHIEKKISNANKKIDTFVLTLKILLIALIFLSISMIWLLRRRD